MLSEFISSEINCIFVAMPLIFFNEMAMGNVFKMSICCH